MQDADRDLTCKYQSGESKVFAQRGLKLIVGMARGSRALMRGLRCTPRTILQPATTLLVSGAAAVSWLLGSVQ